MQLMHFRGFLSGILALSLNLSLCTGGILSSFTVFAAELEPPKTEDGIVQSMPMSFAALEYMSCTTTTTDASGVQSRSVPHGCKDKQTCLTQSHHSTIDRSFQFLSALQGLVAFPVHADQVVVAYEVDLYATARAGPLFEDSIVYARSLQKRE